MASRETSDTPVLFFVTLASDTHVILSYRSQSYSFLEINLTRTSRSATGISLFSCLPRYDPPHDDGASPGQYSQHTEDMAFTTYAPLCQLLLVFHLFTPPCCSRSFKAPSRSVEIDRLDSQFEWSSPAIPT